MLIHAALGPEMDGCAAVLFLSPPAPEWTPLAAPTPNMLHQLMRGNTNPLRLIYGVSVVCRLEEWCGASRVHSAER